MIVASHGIIGSSIGQVDADYQAILDYATTQGYTLPSASQRLLQEQLVIDLKDNGIWNKLDTFAVFATDGDEDFALIDWKRVIDFTAVMSPPFTPNVGFEGDGVAAHIDLNYQSQTDWVNVTQDNATQFVLNTSDNPLNNLITGASVAYTSINPRNPTDSRVLRLHSEPFSSPYSVGDVVGLHTTTRETSNTLNYYFNGSFVNSSVISNIVASADYYLFRNISIFFNGNARIYGYGAGLDSTEVLNLNNAINTYITSI